MKNLKHYCILLGAILAIGIGLAFAQTDSKPSVHVPREGVLRNGGLLSLGSSISVTSTVTKSVGQNFLPFSGNSFTITGAQGPYAETTVYYGTPYVTSNGIGNVTVSNLQLFYALTDTTDGTLQTFSNTAGTGSALQTIALTAGTPLEFDNSSGTTTYSLSSSWQSLKMTAGTTAGGLATSSTSTNFHVRSSLSN